MLGLGSTLVNGSALTLTVTDWNTTVFLGFDSNDTRYIFLTCNAPLGGTVDDLLQFTNTTYGDQLSTSVEWTLRVARVDSDLVTELEVSSGRVYAYRGQTVAGGTLGTMFLSNDDVASFDLTQSPGTDYYQEGDALIDFTTFGGVDVTDGPGTDAYVLRLTGVASGYQNLTAFSIPLTFETV